MILEIKSEWRETGIPCQACGAMTYSDGKHRPQCGDRACLATLENDVIWTWLIMAKGETE